MARKKTQSELQQAETRYRTLLDKRDAINAEARTIREERDLLNAQKGELRREANALRDCRAELIRQVRSHKERRNDLQHQARDFVQLQRQLKGKLHGGIDHSLDGARRRVADLENRQQTTTLTLDEEDRLLQELRDARASLEELEAIAQEHQELLQQVGEGEDAIDDLYARAEVEHQEVLRKSESVQTLREEIDGKMDTLSLLIAEANKVHEAFLAVKAKADRHHQRAQDMREKVLAVKRARRAEYAESMRAVRAQNASVREALEDDEAVENALDEALSTLKKDGKLEL